MSEGYFVGLYSSGDIAIAGRQINYEGGNSPGFRSVPKSIVPDLRRDSTWAQGYFDILNEFADGGRTDRAKQVLKVLPAAEAGSLDSEAALVTAFVTAVRDWSGDKGIGGDIATIVLERGKGWRWFRRPDFCPEN